MGGSSGDNTAAVAGSAPASRPMLTPAPSSPSAAWRLSIGNRAAGPDLRRRHDAGCGEAVHEARKHQQSDAERGARAGYQQHGEHRLAGQHGEAKQAQQPGVAKPLAHAAPQRRADQEGRRADSGCRADGKRVEPQPLHHQRDKRHESRLAEADRGDRDCQAAQKRRSIFRYCSSPRKAYFLFCDR